MALPKGILLIFCLLFLSNANASPQPKEGRIVGGVEISLSLAPYQVSLLYKSSHVCGGSIISKNFVLTACHCTYGRTAATLSIRAGSKVKNEGGEIHQVYIVRNHPYYNKYSFDYDYAILQLKTSIVLDGVSKAAITLPAFNEPIVDDTDVVVTGFGATQNLNESSSNLRGVVLQIFNQLKCNEIYKYDTGITKQMICASSSGKDSCSGDSGGPMRCLKTNKLIGIVSFGSDLCADPRFPGVYSRVSAVRPWIQTYAKV